jgi:hypothetical protein
VPQPLELLAEGRQVAARVGELASRALELADDLRQIGARAFMLRALMFQLAAGLCQR